MQIFIIGSPLETAEALDPKRLRSQINKCEVVLKARFGSTATEGEFNN